MRYILFPLMLTFTALFCSAQGFYNYTDTLNKFSIDIPVGWKYGTNKNFPNLKLLVFYQSKDSADLKRDNFNINIFEPVRKDLENAFSSLLQGIQSAVNFELIDTGNIAIKGREFKWLIERHDNQFTKVSMHNYTFVTFQ